MPCTPAPTTRYLVDSGSLRGIGATLPAHGLPPSPVAADEVSGALDTEIDEGGGGETGLISLVAHEDHLLAGLDCDASMLTRRRQSPLEDVPLDDDRTGEISLTQPVGLRSDVDEDGTVGDSGLQVARFHPPEPGPGGLEVTIDSCHPGRCYRDSVRGMRAAVLRAVDEPLTIEDIDLSEVGPFEVRVRVAAAGLCHSDVRFMEGSYPVPLPAVLGHESAGIVEEVGDRVSHVTPGDHVITFLSVFCGTCSYCVTGHTNLCSNREATQRRPGEPPRLSSGDEPLHQFLNLASFAERMLIHENALVKVSDEMPLDRAALLGCGVATGLGAVFNTAGVRPGETVAVIGCGGVGLSAVQGARIAGAGTIVAVDRIQDKLRLASALGATHTLDASSDDPVAMVKELTGGPGVHHSFEAIGNRATAEMAFGMLRPGGAATVIGLIPVGERVSVPGHELLDEKRLQGSNMGSNRFRIDVPAYVSMYLDGRLNLDDMISGTMGIDDINAGFDQMRTGAVARNLIVFD